MNVIAKGAIERLLAGQTELRRDGIDPLSLAFRQAEEENNRDRDEDQQPDVGIIDVPAKVRGQDEQPGAAGQRDQSCA